MVPLECSASVVNRDALQKFAHVYRKTGHWTRYGNSGDQAGSEA